ncbi:MAG: alpha/beta fold hydrolase [Candidatus Promineifilaceae bacterium]|jgi:haloalkane dehalogenase
MIKPAVQKVIDAHEAGGRRFDAGGLQSFVRERGQGDPIILFHGIPSSSYLYRKVIPLLAERGFRALSFDLPGLGFADRPPGFDYTFGGLGSWAVKAVDTLGLGRFHLVVHDAGGPVGFEMAKVMPERIRSLTLLNTVVDLKSVPFAMEFYARFATGEHWPALPPAWATRELIYRVGINDRGATPPAEVDVYRELVLREDNGRAYLELMRNLDQTRKDGADYSAVIDTRKVPYPVQIIWSADDRTLSLREHGWKAREQPAWKRSRPCPANTSFRKIWRPKLPQPWLFSRPQHRRHQEDHQAVC